MARSYGTDFTTGSLPKKMLLFSLPFMGANMLQVVYSMVDMMIVGRFVGSNALSAVNSGAQICTFFTMFCVGYETGAQVYLSQIIGAGRKDKLNGAIGTIFSFTVLMGIFATLVCVLGCKGLLGLLNTPPEAFGMAVDYLLICGGFIVFTFGYNLVSTLQRAQGDSRRPLYFILIATVINVVLDLLFTGYLGWGTRGAAAATVIGQAVSFFIAIAYLYQHRQQFGFDFKPGSFRIDRKILAEVNKLGGVNVIQFCVIYLSMIVVTSMVNKLGVAASATLAIGLKVDDVMVKVAHALYISCTAVVGQNFAAGRHDRVRHAVHITWLYVGILYVVFALVYLLGSRQVFSAFTDDLAVLDLTRLWVLASICGFPGIISMRGTSGVIQGTGFVFFSFCTALADAFVARIGMAYLFGTVMGLGLFGYFLGYLCACYATAIPGLIYYLSGRWTRRALVIGE